MEVENKEKDEQFLNLDSLLEIIGNPTRRVILAKIAKVPHSASELARALNISRQAVHSQLKLLSESGLIENVGPDPRGGKYRIKSNISVRIDITPDYYKINYKLSKIDKKTEGLALKDIGCHIDYKKIQIPGEKLRFLGEQIKTIERNIGSLEDNRRDLLQNKECLIKEIKNIMRSKYEKELMVEELNLEKELFYTIFYNPIKYFKRINIDKLLDDMFFSDMTPLRRDRHRVDVRNLLTDLSKFMDFFREDKDGWFFDL